MQDFSRFKRLPLELRHDDLLSFSSVFILGYSNCFYVSSFDHRAFLPLFNSDWFELVMSSLGSLHLLIFPSFSLLFLFVGKNTLIILSLMVAFLFTFKAKPLRILAECVS